jgi:hypothetical protein
MNIFVTPVTRLPCSSHNKVFEKYLFIRRWDKKNLNNDCEVIVITIRKLMSEVASIELSYR